MKLLKLTRKRNSPYKSQLAEEAEKRREGSRKEHPERREGVLIIN
jgi:hypothetical protein